MDENYEADNFLDLLVDSLADFSYDDLELINDLDFEFLQDDQQNTTSNLQSYESNKSAIDTNENKNESTVLMSAESQYNKHSESSDPYEESSLSKKAKNMNDEYPISSNILQQKIEKSTNRLRFLARWTEISRRQVLRFERGFLPTLRNFNSLPKSKDKVADSQYRISVASSTNLINALSNRSATGKPSNSINNSINPLRASTYPMKRKVANYVSASFGKTVNTARHSHRYLGANLNNIDVTNFNSMHKLRSSMNRTQISRRMFTQVIQKEKLRRLELMQNQESKRKSFTYLNLSRKGARLDVSKNIDHSAHSA